MRSCEKGAWHLLNMKTEMQLLEDVCTKLSPRYFTPVGGVNGSIQQILEMQGTSLGPNFEFELS